MIGAGHVGAALVPLLVGLAFRVTLVDERPGMARPWTGWRTA